MSSRTDWSVKQKWSRSRSVMPDSLQLHSPGILQARILEWVAFPFPRGSSQPRDRIQVSCTAGGFFTHWTTREAQEYWSGWPIPSPADLPHPGIKRVSCIAGRFFTNWAIRETQWNRNISAINMLLLCARHCCKHFKSIKALSPHKNPIGQIPLSSPL